MDPPKAPASAMFRDLSFRPRITTTSTLPRRRPSLAAGSGISKRKLSKSPTSPVLAFFNDTASVSFFERMFGEEYPEAFASGDGFAKKRKTILDLPAELLEIIAQHISKIDIKRMRLSCKTLAAKIELPIDRVYISPNRANLGCFRQVINHPRYRKRVREVVWDDAQLQEYSTLEAFREALHHDEKVEREDLERRLHSILYDEDTDEPMNNDDEFSGLEYDDFFDNGVLTEFGKGAIMRHRNDKLARDIIARHATKMSLEDSYELYQVLYQEERELMKQNMDAAALQYALSYLPNLKRIVLTSEVWRPWYLYPIYDTPFFRALPPGFRKPTIWPWFQMHPNSPTPDFNMWQDALTDVSDHLPPQWRGYSNIVSSLLTIPNHKVDEFIVDVQNERTGICWQLFATPSEDYTRTLQMMQTIPLTRLQLSLHPILPYWTKWDFLCDGRLKQALESLTHLQHLDFSAQNGAYAPLPIDKVFPQRIPTLQHFTLRRTKMEEDDLYALLGTMPHLESVHLHFIDFVSGGLVSLFSRIRDNIQSPDPGSRLWKFTCPHFSVGDRSTVHPDDSKYVFIDEELNEFVYGDEMSAIPWQKLQGWVIEQPKPGVGWIVDGKDMEYKVKVQEDVYCS